MDDISKSTTAITPALKVFHEASMRADDADRALLEAQTAKDVALAQMREARYQATITVPCRTCSQPIGQPCNWGNIDFHWYITHSERQTDSGVTQVWVGEEEK